MALQTIVVALTAALLAAGAIAPPPIDEHFWERIFVTGQSFLLTNSLATELGNLSYVWLVDFILIYKNKKYFTRLSESDFFLTIHAIVFVYLKEIVSHSFPYSEYKDCGVVVKCKLS